MTYADTERPPSKDGALQAMVTDVDVISLTVNGPVGTDGTAVNQIFKNIHNMSM